MIIEFGKTIAGIVASTLKSDTLGSYTQGFGFTAAKQQFLAANTPSNGQAPSTPVVGGDNKNQIS